MGKMFLPISIKHNQDREFTADIIRKVEADRVFFGLLRLPFERGESYFCILNDLKEQMKYYKEQGFKTCVWTSTLGYGPLVEEFNREKANEYTKIRSIHGDECGDAFCPLDDNFFNMVAAWIEDFCIAGADMIMLDDEITLSQRPGIGCACDKHIEEYRKRLGEDILLEEIPEKAFAGEGNHYRKVWLDLMGDTMRDYVRKLRAVIDKVNPEIRFGFCTGHTSWDIEGVDPIELSKIMAGNTEPFLRFTGAPYWACGNRYYGRITLQTVIEMIRMQYAWCIGSGVEVFTEADSFPHNRFHTPAAVNELYDIATRVSDDMNSLKYNLDYYNHKYDMGYTDLHIENMPLYEKIKEVYTELPATGIRVYQEMRKFADAKLADWVEDESSIMQKAIIPHAQCLLSSNAIPTTYVGSGVCGIAFGDNIKYVPKSSFEKGMIIDLKAAQILMDKGVDVGLKSFELMHGAFVESFNDGKDNVCAHDCWDYYNLTIDESAKPVSYYKHVDLTNKNEYPAAYLYENADSQRFLVYAFIGENLEYSSSFYWCYPRAKQIADAVRWLSRGKELPCVSFGNPHMYCICKENDDTLAAGYFNCSIDKAKKVKVNFEKAVQNAEFINCSGELTDEYNAVIEKIDAYEFAGIKADYKKG